jgi:hypothetical protein
MPPSRPPDRRHQRPAPTQAARFACLAAAATLAPLVAIAADPQPAGFEQRGRHEHGAVIVNVALEGATLSVAVESPAINVVGFERAPRDAAEKARVAAADRWLASGTGIVGVPAAAGCSRTRVEYAPPKLGDGAGHDHDHAGDHDHDAKGDAAEAQAHADYDARFVYTCANPGALAWLDLWLAQRLLAVESIEVNLVVPGGQSQRRLAPGQTRVPLR